MCGIVGAVNLSNKRRMREEDITRMAETMVHRGPDDSGIFVDDRIALGHRRLTIIDLSSLGRQPMIDSTGKVTIVYNGEIYNYIEIKEILLKKGYVFNSNTDTEVILNAYLEYGIECLVQFNGMFAFALYDKRNDKVFVVRDRIGIKPLYYTQRDGRLIFSSEIKGILKYPDFKTSVNLNGVSSYLSCRYPIRENTLFENISSLLPGNYLEISAEKVTRKQYWDMPVCEEKEDRGEEYYLRHVHSLLETAVKYRMRSDVPFGAYLSGGLDSSIIVAMMSKFTDEPVKTFTIGFDVKGYNEFDYARLVADRYQTNHFEITLSSKHYIDNMIKLIRYKDSPL
ncbi:MAG: asparagine synthase (glutamine-hydrolyzing), partial [Candidatus Zixiibacteriota bacterium]